VSFIFAPIFFASIGLKVNFLTYFDGPLVLTVLLITCVGKLAGGILGARWGNASPRSPGARFCHGFRRCDGDHCGTIGPEAGIIRQRLFVALVIMAMATSMMGGPAMRLISPAYKKVAAAGCPLIEAFSAGTKGRLPSRGHPRDDSGGGGSGRAGCESLEAAVWTREEALSTVLEMDVRSHTPASKDCKNLWW
jgi:hypothetical protein